jgi:hypothetical protein
MPRSSRTIRNAAAAVAVLIVASACGERSGKVLDEPVFPPPATTIVATTLPTEPAITAPAIIQPLALVAPWVDGAALPDRHTCADAGVSPALTWTNVPSGTVELALSVVDLDADQYVHWLVYGLLPVESGLAEGQLPPSALEWPNSSGQSAWSPPCPPAGEQHRYVFTVYALNQQLEAADDASATEVLSILNATTIAQSSVSGTASG